MRIEDLTGKKFNRLTAIEYIGHRTWLCRCECGNTVKVKAYDLKNGRTKSCGCFNAEKTKRMGEKYGKIYGKIYGKLNIHNAIEAKTTHGETKTRLYRIWKDIHGRCNNDSSGNYGNRGITYCKEWENFIPFRDWALANGYDDTLTIDRIDVNGNYEPANCRWVSRKIQCRNTRRNIFLTYNGETHCLKEWETITGLPVQQRYTKCGWSVEKCLTEPLRQKKS